MYLLTLWMKIPDIKYEKPIDSNVVKNNENAKCVYVCIEVTEIAFPLGYSNPRKKTVYCSWYSIT